VQDTLVGLISKDATFTPVPSITGFATISPGIQLSTTVSNALFRGTSTDAQSLGGISSSQFLRNDTNGTTSGTLGVLNDSGLTVGVDQDAKISVNTSTSEVTLQNQTQDANLSVKVNDGGVTTTVMLVNGSTAVVSFPTTLSLNSAAGATALINAAGNGVGNIGSSSSYFNTVFAKATSAQYADVAERFAADAYLEPGTVVELGGTNEITMSISDLSEEVFGVVSTNAAYLMNSGAGDDQTHPPIAMTGRVPVKVNGVVRKGDRLVSAGSGTARAALPGEATAFNVIGRALEAKTTTGLGLVESIVTIK
jgi:hypothetical protein